MGHFSLSIDGHDEKLMTIFPAMISMWVACWVYSYLLAGKKIEAFSTSGGLHDFHSVVIIIASLISLYYDDDKVFPERLGNAFSLSYFLVDWADCLVRFDLPFLAHASLSLVAIGGCYVSRAHQMYRSASKVLLIEASTPLLHTWQRSKKKKDFVLFFTLFTVFRMIWFPIFLYKAFMEPNIPLDYVYFSSALLLPLQILWWTKMATMLSNYKEKKSEKTES